MLMDQGEHPQFKSDHFFGFGAGGGEACLPELDGFLVFPFVRPSFNGLDFGLFFSPMLLKIR